jgi:formylglycine-generating enzyme required for sulfatase activity
MDGRAFPWQAGGWLIEISGEVMGAQPISTQALPPGTRVEEFVIERVLGAGGFGITYLAKDTALGRRVVIKENLPAQFCFRDPSSLTVAPRHSSGEDVDNFQWSLENFSKEAAMLASLDHPGIVRVLRSFEAFGTAYFVMPYVEGVALDELIKQRNGEQFTERELAAWLGRMLDALGHLHDRGIYHRDIKPGNLLITDECFPVLIDFGSARQRLSERSLTVVESAGYTPFEQLQTRGNVGPWSDLYALGATLVKVITGETPPKTNDRTMGDPWQPLCGRQELQGRYAEAFLAGIDRALQLPIEERWQSAEEWKKALGSGKVGKVPDVSGKQNGTGAPPDRASAIGAKKSAGPAVFAVVAMLLLGIGGWWILGGESGVLSKPPAVGGLVLTSEPSAAKVLGADGRDLGVTPLELKSLPIGQAWNGRLELPDYLSAELSEEVPVGETRLVPPVKLQPQPQKVTVTSEPAGAEVLEDGKVLGVTPWESDPREVESEVALTLRLVGYEEESLGGEVELGSTLMLQAKLEPIPQKVVVMSEPAGAQVMGGGKMLGVTPLDLPEVLPGTKVSYQLKLDGYEEAQVEGEVLVGKPLELAAVLEVLPERAFEGTKAGEEREFEIAPGVKMTFCWCPAGEFVMGSPADELGHESNEKQVKVKLSNGFWLAKTKVTHAQWRGAGGIEVSGRPPAFYDGKVQLTWEEFAADGILVANFKGGDLPVERVDWNEVRDWCLGMTERLRNDGQLSGDWKLVLPTEAQWEYACRAGTDTALHSGRNLTSEGACGNLDEVGWYDKNTKNRTQPVGEKEVNGWGLHDMHGNVFEWCADWYGEELGGGVDPQGAVTGVHRAIRGGSWNYPASNCRAAIRIRYLPGNRGIILGFRPALVPSK